MAGIKKNTAFLFLAALLLVAPGCVDDENNPIDPVLDAAFLG